MNLKIIDYNVFKKLNIELNHMMYDPIFENEGDAWRLHVLVNEIIMKKFRYDNEIIGYEMYFRELENIISNTMSDLMLHN